jgi:hypothetical protein
MPADGSSKDFLVTLMVSVFIIAWGADSQDYLNVAARG